MYSSRLRSLQDHAVGLHAAIAEGSGRGPEVEPEATVERLAPAADDLRARGLQIFGPGLTGEEVVVAIVRPVT